MLPFLLLATRAEDEAADKEYDAFLGFTGLDESTLHRVRLEQRPARTGRPRRLVRASSSAAGRSTPATDAAAKSPCSAGSRPSCAACSTRCVARDFPFLGACYGIGVDRHATSGGTVDRTYSEPIGRVPVTLTDDGPRATRCSPTCRTPSRRSSGTRRRSASCRRAPCTSRRRRPARCRRSGSGRTSTRRSSTPSSTSTGSAPASTSTSTPATSSPSQAEAVKAMARAGAVFEPPKMLRTFVQRYAADRALPERWWRPRVERCQSRSHERDRDLPRRPRPAARPARGPGPGARRVHLARRRASGSTGPSTGSTPSPAATTSRRW